MRTLPGSSCAGACRRALAAAAVVSFATLAGEPDLAALVADRTAVERVYYMHRLGQKPPFEKVSPRAVIERLVKDELRRQSALERVYGVSVGAADLAAEARRIDATSRAPEMLAEIKAALGNDPDRFAQTFVRPIVVERLLRDRFENDDARHAPQRRLAEAVRARLLATEGAGFSAQLAVMKAATGGHLQEQVTWEFGPRSGMEAGAPQPVSLPVPTPTKARGGLYAIEATAQPAQVLSAPGRERSDQAARFSFSDLAPEMRNVLRAQLTGPGRVSAVIELPTTFQIYLARELSSAHLSATVVTFRKLDFEEWLATQPEN